MHAMQSEQQSVHARVHCSEQPTAPTYLQGFEMDPPQKQKVFTAAGEKTPRESARTIAMDVAIGRRGEVTGEVSGS